jgi:uncharacterized repeat protein (TIGR01451 family)
MKHDRFRNRWRFCAPSGRRPACRVLALLVAVAGLWLGGAAAAQANTCYQATGAATNTLCWLDLTGYAGTVGVATPLSFTLPDGSTLSLTLTNTGTSAAPIAAFPTYVGSSLGNQTYTGVLGKPAIYGGGTITVKLSGITVTDSSNNQLPEVTMVAADAETLDTGDGNAASITWTTAGTGWADTQILQKVGGGTTPICTMTGLGTATAKCTASTSGNNAAYALSTTVTPAQSITMSLTTGSLQGYAFAVNLAQLAAAKTISGRVNASDQFKVATTRGATTIASATTTGTGTTAATGLKTVLVGSPYTISETATSGSLSNYVSKYACTNATTGSTTTLPSGTGTSFTVSPAVTDAITCTFTNSGLLLTDVPVSATKNVNVAQSVTDLFTLTNAGTVSGTFEIGTPSVSAAGTALTPTGYTFNGTTYTSVAALQTAITAAGATAAGGSITVGVVYTVSATAGTQIDVALPATVASGTSASSSAGTSETDTAINQISITKTATAQSSPGGAIGYQIVISNNGPSSQNNTVVTDTMPTGVTIVGTPTCGSASGGAACGSVTVSGTTVTGTAATFPSGGSVTFSIAATAAAANTYVNTATATPPTANAVSASATTIVSSTNGLLKTVRNVTQGVTTGGTTGTANPGDTLEYGLTFTNTTATTLSQMVFNDATPVNTTFVSAAYGTLPAGITSCTITKPAVGATGAVSWTFAGSLAPGATLTATFRVTVNN